ncbi:MAG: recombinase family protein [Candidatus Odinarchaeia archaeon]
MEENKNPGICAIYARVSTSEQNVNNQIEKLKTLSSLQNYRVETVYIDVMSGGSANRPQFQQMLNDARLRKFDTIFVWSLDRFSREGINNTLSYLKRLKHHKVSLKSLQEPWLDTSDNGMGELLIAIFSWVAEQERKRISERTKAGMLRSKTNHTGRPKGKKDNPNKPRSKAGYYNRWNVFNNSKKGGSKSS